MHAKSTSAIWRDYSLSVLGWMGCYAGLIVGLSYARNAGLLDGPHAWFVALLPAVPVAGVMWAVLRSLRESDEYVRALQTKRFVLATGATFVLCAGWGFAEVYAAAPHAPLYLVFPVFWAAFGVISPFVRDGR